MVFIQFCMYFLYFRFIFVDLKWILNLFMRIWKFLYHIG